MVDPGANGLCVVIRGVKGFLEGERFVLRVGEAMVIGRSRRADVSTRRAERLRAREDWQRILRKEPFLTVSRRHVRLHFLHPGLLEIKDISANGTYLDGRRIDCVAVTDLNERSHLLAVGAQEQFELTLSNGED
jgi:hypothetical protein